MYRTHAQKTRRFTKNADQSERLGRRNKSMTVGVTILELFARAADQLSFAEEEIVTEAYLGSAAPLIILDGLLGVGGKPPLREPIRAACRSINRLRTAKSASCLPLISRPASTPIQARRIAIA